MQLVASRADRSDHTAVNQQVGACDKTGMLAQQEGACLGDLFFRIVSSLSSVNYSNLLAESQRCTLALAFAAWLPVTGRPFFTTAPGQAFLMSRSLEPIPLPSLVQSGRMVLPVKSKASRKVKTAMGMVPQ